MKKFEGMLFCTDLDGTLYTSSKTVSQENLEAIEYFKSEGGLFTFITGRVPKTSVEMRRTIKPNAPIGCFNGGAIYDAKNEAYLWNMTLPREMLELVRAVDENFPSVSIQLNTEQDVCFNKDCRSMQWFCRVTGLPGNIRHYDDVQEPVLKVVFSLDRVEEMGALQSLLHSHPKASMFDFIRSELNLYEILPKGVSKGGALCKMAELLGIDRKKTIAVGDYDNDISMIQNAGLGFAVANAVDGAKAVADHITVDNDHHAIAEIIRGIDSGKYQI